MAKILVIDDTELIRKLIVAILHAHGHEVLEAKHGEEAFEWLEKVVPAVIICDIAMPVLDGRQFLIRLRASPFAWINRLPVIILSANEGIEIGAEMLALGAAAVVLKTSLHGDLLKRLNLLLS